ncbi:protein translocase subunit SecD [Sessilibacter corallicola]|uniref:Protein translocase subunit SecD n=1 Tax=Sessilibacter corallicola TaxID=2904075 RepID=A0ABQ0A9Y0_9GAMM|nr:protein translocase subunit SecD [Sessilibacter corallicola]MCE2029234.1 protein translocase subunit SecD [Sessilibacter corallicola]
MLNRYPLWKYILILFVIVLGLVYAAPNLYAPDPAIQVSGQSSGLEITQKDLDRASKALEESGIEYFGGELQERAVLIRLASADDQKEARKAVQRALGSNYVVALNQASNTPQWLQSLAATPMKLGLDLSGGVHFLMEVDTQDAVNKRQATNANELKKKWREVRALYEGRVLVSADNVIEARFSDEAEREEAISVARSEFPDLIIATEERDGKFFLQLTMSEFSIREIEDYAVSQNLVTLRNRVNELGVSEPLVQRQGRNRIVVELPGVQDTAEAKRVIGKTANLEFRLGAESNTPASQREQYEFRPEEGENFARTAWLERKVIITGENVSNARPGIDPQTGQAEVSITLDSDGGSKMHRATWKNIGRSMGVLFVEYKTLEKRSIDEEGNEVITNQRVIEKNIINLATIQAALGVQFRITGLDSPVEASELALLLRAGALAAPMFFVQESTIGPSLGAENIELGVLSVQLGLGFVLIFMLVYYRVFGLAANIALTANLVLLIAIMSLFGATLTLPGIAGIVLTVGMAVDANVLIFSRIREEIKNGLPPQSAINSGFERAFTTILDANITTLIVAIILFGIGSGPVKGFAVTLSIGILTSMFSAIMVTRAIVNMIYGGRRVEKLWI